VVTKFALTAADSAAMRSSTYTGELLESIDAHHGTITSLAWCPRKVKSPGAAAPHAVLATSRCVHLLDLCVVSCATLYIRDVGQSSDLI